MATDRVLIEELSALLDTRDECWTKEARAFDKDDCVVPAETIEDVFVVSSDPPLDNDTSIKWDGQGFVSCRRSNTKDTRTMKRKIRQQKEAVRKRRYQERLKNERETLRRMETELSQQLRTLKREADSRKRAALDKLAHASSIWRQRAHQERGQRLQAENEQKKLVTAVSVQASYLVNLQELLPCIDQEARLAIASSITMNTQTNHILYEEHLQRVEAGYNQVDDVFSGFDLLAMPDGMTTSMHRSEPEGSIEYFQHFNKFTQPFSFKQTQHTMWTLAKLHHRLQDREDYHGLGCPDDTVVIRYRLVRTLVTGAKVSVMQRYIFRRFVGEDHTVFIWKTYSEGEGIFAGLLLEETGWVRHQPSDEDGSTVVSVCVRQVPMRFGSSSPSQSEAQEFYSVMQSSLDEDAQAITSTLSRLLLEETLAGIDI